MSPQWWLDISKTLIGTFAGALLAFGSAIAIDVLRRRRDDRAAGNLAMFVLSRQLDGFLNVSRGIEEEMHRLKARVKGGTPPNWVLVLRPLEFKFDESLQHNWSTLAFLTKKNPNLLGQLAHVSQLYFALVTAVQKQASIARELQRVLETATNRVFTGEFSVESLQHALGPVLVGAAESTVEILRHHVQEDEKEYRRAGTELHRAMASHFWGGGTILRLAPNTLTGSSNPPA